jgi:hypothetical protein
MRPGLNSSSTGEEGDSVSVQVVSVEVTVRAPILEPNSVTYKTFPVPVVSRVWIQPT